ncbi:sugar ABC transporter permease [Cohnella ginsengisoli]|uniref:carbohydrate ABC transporter permease n=1 Tax=Cohnella ginsengisoli TaxID=425004 RepID=UPI0030B88ABF
MKTKTYAPYYFLAPAVILFAVFMVYPIVYSFWLSFQTSQGGELSFAGLDNYRRLAHDGIFWTALKNTFILLAIQVPLMLGIAIVLAALLNGAKRFKGLFRVSFFMPSVTSLVAYSIIFSIMLMGDGLINQLLGAFGIKAIPWLSDPIWAKAALILAMTWRWAGYNMVIYLAAMQNIPRGAIRSGRSGRGGRRAPLFLRHAAAVEAGSAVYFHP